MTDATRRERLSARPQGPLALRYRILAGDAPLASVTFSPLGPTRLEPRAPALAGRAYHLRQRGPLGGELWVETRDPADDAVGGAAGGAAGERATQQPTQTLLHATQDSPLRRQYTVEAAGRRFTLRAESPLSHAYLLVEGERVAGNLRPVGALGRALEADLPADLPLATRVALVWLTLWLWRRRRPTNASAGG